MLLWNQYRCSLKNIAKNLEHIQTTKTDFWHATKKDTWLNQKNQKEG